MPRAGAAAAGRPSAASSPRNRPARSPAAADRCPACRCAPASRAAPSIRSRSGCGYTSGSVSGRFRIASCLPGQVIGRPGVGEREPVGDIEMVLVLLAARDDRAGEAVVQPFPPGAGDVRHHAVEHAPRRRHRHCSRDRRNRAGSARSASGPRHRPSSARAAGCAVAVSYFRKLTKSRTATWPRPITFGSLAV